MRNDHCEKDGISVTYTEKDVCFEDTKTAQALLILNDGTIAINNFDEERTLFLLNWYKKIMADRQLTINNSQKSDLPPYGKDNVNLLTTNYDTIFSHLLFSIFSIPSQCFHNEMLS